MYTPKLTSDITGLAYNTLTAWQRRNIYMPCYPRMGRTKPKYSYDDLIALRILTILNIQLGLGYRKPVFQLSYTIWQAIQDGQDILHIYTDDHEVVIALNIQKVRSYIDKQLKKLKP